MRASASTASETSRTSAPSFKAHAIKPRTMPALVCASLINQRLRHKAVIARRDQQRRTFGNEQPRFLADFAHFKCADRLYAIIGQRRNHLRRTHDRELQRTNSEVGTHGPLFDWIASSPRSNVPPLPFRVSCNT